jgi:hypothetical protein
MIDKFGLWTYNDGWQVLLLVCVLFVASGILLGILWNTKGLTDELSGRKRKKELEYLRHRFAEMNVRSLDEVKIADPLSHVGESAPAPLTPAGGVFTPQGVQQQPLGAGEVLHVGGVAVSQQQVAAIKSELLGDDDEPVTGFFAGAQDDKASRDTRKEVASKEEANKERANKEEAKPQPVETRKEEAKPLMAEAPKLNSQQGINPAKVSQGASVSEKPADTANKIPSVKEANITPVKPAMLLVQAHAEQAFGSEQVTGLLTPEEDDDSDSTPTGIFTPAEPTAQTAEPSTKSTSQTPEPVAQTAEPATKDSSEGITANLSPEVEDAAGVTTLFAPAGSRSAYRMEGAQFMGEIISTGSYDPKTDTTKLEAPSGVDKATTGFLND